MKYCNHCGRKLKKDEKNRRNLCTNCYQKLLYDKLELLKNKSSSIKDDTQKK